MFLGIEIGGTKLQLGVGAGNGKLDALERFEVQPKLGAEGIMRQIETAARALGARYDISAIGIGFGGPVDSAQGVVVKSHHVEGWENYPLVDWCRRTLRLPASLQNDCDVAGLAEARYGAGKGAKVVFFITVGTGIGGGLIVEGQIYRGSGHGAAEIGHLRPGLDADHPDKNLESHASGWGIAATARARLREARENEKRAQADLLDRGGGKPEQLTTLDVAQAAGEGNTIARDVLAGACRALGWAMAQVITLVSPEVVVIGGGVSLMDERLFLVPVRREVDRYVFPPFVGTFRILPAKLGEEVVVHGALAAAADSFRAR